MSLESKYVLRLFDGVVTNTWKFELRRAVIKPHVDAFKATHGGVVPSIGQIRNRAR